MINGLALSQRKKVKEGITYYNCYYYIIFICFFFIKVHQILVYFDNVYKSMKVWKRVYILKIHRIQSTYFSREMYFK